MILTYHKIFEDVFTNNSLLSLREKIEDRSTFGEVTARISHLFDWSEQ